MELNKRCNYSCHSQKPWYFVRMVQDFYCCPSYYKDDNKYDHKDDCNENRFEHKCNCNNRGENNYNWEREFENRYWNNQYFKEEDKKENCCNRKFYN